MTTKTRLRKVVLMAIRGNTDLRKKLKKLMDISDSTLYRMLNENSDDLTKADVMNLIRQELNLGLGEILESINEPSEVKEA